MTRTLQEVIDFSKMMKPNQIGKLQEILETYQKEITSETINDLSISELKAAKAIFSDNEIFRTYSVKEIAEKTGVQRGTIVTTMDKLKIAGIIEHRSMGCKGCFVKVINKQLFEILKNL